MFQPLAFPAPPSPPRVASLRSPMEAGKPKEKLRKPIKTKESHRPTKTYHMFQPPAPRESNLRSFLIVSNDCIIVSTLFSHCFSYCFLHGFRLFSYDFVIVSL